MKYILKSKNTEEPVSTIETTGSLDEAKSFFQTRKQLDSHTFESLFEVERHIEKPRHYEWWKEEITTPDIERG